MKLYRLKADVDGYELQNKGQSGVRLSQSRLCTEVELRDKLNYTDEKMEWFDPVGDIDSGDIKTRGDVEKQANALLGVLKSPIAKELPWAEAGLLDLSGGGSAGKSIGIFIREELEKLIDAAVDAGMGEVPDISGMLDATRAKAALNRIRAWAVN